jgi:hypothetical protein
VPSDVCAVYCIVHSSDDGGFSNDHHTWECAFAHRRTRTHKPY